MIDERILKSDERAVLTLRSLYKSYGYSSFKMSKFEEYDLYLSNKDFLVSDRVIAFNDTTGKLLALKPDVTLSIIKNTDVEKGSKAKVYYNENVYRVSGTSGQFKEIMQTGLECIGKLDVADIFEVLLLAVKSLRAISEDFILDLSHMGILAAFLNEAGAGEAFNKEMLPLITAKNSHEALAVCKKYGVGEAVTEKIIALCRTYGNFEEVLKKLLPLCDTDESKAAYNQLTSLWQLLSLEELSERVRIDFSVAGNMNYYNGIVFRGFISGISEGVLSGGEYDKLLINMGKRCNAIGFALYLDLLSALDGESESYDVDVFILYGENTSYLDLVNKKTELINLGKTVTSGRVVPEELRYKEILEM